MSTLTTTAAPARTLRSKDLKVGRWENLPDGWTQEEQPKKSNIWRRYAPLPKGKKARADELARRSRHRHAAKNERTNYTFTPQVQAALNAVRTHLGRIEAEPVSEQRLIGRMAYTLHTDLQNGQGVHLLDLPKDAAGKARAGFKGIGLEKAGEIPSDDSDLLDDDIIRFVGDRAHDIAYMAEQEGLHPDAFMAEVLKTWLRVKNLGLPQDHVEIDSNARDHAERCLQDRVHANASMKELVAGLLLKESQRLDAKDAKVRREENGL
jgi:hypothetical protein